MAAPPLPPLPPNYLGGNSQSQNPGRPPPIPPLPPTFNEPARNPAYSQYDQQYGSPPHFQDPLVAPRPHRLDPNLPANMAGMLDEQSNGYRGSSRGPSPQPPPQNYQQNYPGGFNNSSQYNQRGPSPLPNPQGAAWSPWNGGQNQNGNLGLTLSPPPALPTPQPMQYSQPGGYQQQQQQPPGAYYQQQQSQYSPPQQYQQPQYSPPQQYQQQLPPQQPQYQQQAPQIPAPQPVNTGALSSSMAALSFISAPSQPPPRTQTMYSVMAPAPASSPPGAISGGVPSLTAVLPSVTSLTSALSAVQAPNADPALKVAWCKEVVFLVDRLQATSGTATDVPAGPAKILDPQLQRMSQLAIPMILGISSPNPMPSPLPVYVAEAIYLRATFAASGAYPDHVRQNPRSAFRDFEAAARGGYSSAWFRLGRDYENFNDFVHAKDCFERGVKLGVESCAYRMGMANLMGQLGLPASQEAALPLLHRAATLASLEVPQPAYVYALLLLSEFSHVSIPAALFTPYIPQSSSLSLEARKHLERAAYLNFSPAQYKLGHAYEFAQPPFPFDPLLSVQYYSLASQQGEIEADMALSKWFLCGAEASFEKDEGLAYTFAEKAARKGLPSAEFAMGYYAEVGVGGPKDIEVAKKWYSRAADHGNADAIDRLKALSQPSPQALSRQEHDTITETQLVRKRTQAQQRSDNALAQAGPGAATLAPPRRLSGDASQVVALVRKNSKNVAHGQYAASSAPGLGQIMEDPNSPSPSGRPSGRPPAGRMQTPPVEAARPRPAQQGGRAYPSQNRYTLTDGPPPADGPAPGPAPGQGAGVGARERRQSAGAPALGPGPGPGRGRGAGRGGRLAASNTLPPGQPTGGMTTIPPPHAETMPPGPGPGPAPAPSSRPAKGPATFAEMGIQGAKAEEKECIIM